MKCSKCKQECDSVEVDCLNQGGPSDYPASSCHEAEIELEEGDDCPDECPGVMGYELVEDCFCHISPPCANCENNPLVCSHCGYTEDE